MSGKLFGDVHVERHGFVAVAEIRRPPHNFFDAELIKDLADAFEEIDHDRDQRAIVLASQGKSFCAGHNFKSGESEETREASGNLLYAQAQRLFASQTPVVAAVHGAAIGGGLGLAMIADFRIAAPNAVFSAPFVRLGFSPGFGLTCTLPRAIGVQKAALLAYTGRRIDGALAREWGLVDDLIPADRLREAAIALATEVAEGAPLAVVAVRRALRRGVAEEVRLAMDREAADQQILSRTLDCVEGTRAAMERRDARFIGE